MLRKCKGKYVFWDNGKWITEEFDLGYFHKWGCNFEEFETSAGNYSVALVELPSGKIVEVYPKDLEFLDTKEFHVEELNYLNNSELEEFKKMQINANTGYICSSKCQHKNVKEIVKGFKICKDCGEIVEISIDK